jgi:hypothetical protein
MPGGNRWESAWKIPTSSFAVLSEWNNGTMEANIDNDETQQEAEQDRITAAAAAAAAAARRRRLRLILVLERFDEIPFR